MTGKLIKYEFRSALRQMWVFWAAAPAVALIVSLIRGGFNSTDFFQENATFIETATRGVAGFAYGAVMVVMLVLTVVIVLSRFYKGLLSEEGYLMHTLPAKPWQLITSKGVVAFIVVLLSGIASVVSIIFLNGLSNLGELFKFFGEIWDATMQDKRYLLIGLEAVIIALFSILKTIYQLYASMSIGQLFDKHRVLATVGAYIGMGIVLSIIATSFISLFGDGAFEMIENWYVDMDEFKTVEFVLLSFIVLSALQVALFHVISERLLSKKLNLL